MPSFGPCGELTGAWGRGAAVTVFRARTGDAQALRPPVSTDTCCVSPPEGWALGPGPGTEPGTEPGAACTPTPPAPPRSAKRSRARASPRQQRADRQVPAQTGLGTAGTPAPRETGPESLRGGPARKRRRHTGTTHLGSQPPSGRGQGGMRQEERGPGRCPVGPGRVCPVQATSLSVPRRPKHPLTHSLTPTHPSTTHPHVGLCARGSSPDPFRRVQLGAGDKRRTRKGPLRGWDVRTLPTCPGTACLCRPSLVLHTRVPAGRERPGAAGHGEEARWPGSSSARSTRSSGEPPGSGAHAALRTPGELVRCSRGRDAGRPPR